jgi:hypothetical protein
LLEAFAPLEQATAGGLSTAAIAHQRKAEGRHGEAVRGTNALMGAVDVVLELERPKGPYADPFARVLRAESRFDTTPEELALRLGEDAYEACGVEETLRRAGEHRQVRELLCEEPQTSAEIAEATGLPGPTVRRHLDELVGEGDATRTGAGRRGDPYEFLSARPLSLTGRKKETGVGGG